jgi:hypothetical protein
MCINTEIIFYLQQERRIFANFHRQVFCWMDKWHVLTMDDIRKLEAETKKELDEVKHVHIILLRRV